jgi:hypothetical protein
MDDRAKNYIRVEPEAIAGFAMIPTAVIEDPQLTAEAKGTWTYLFSRPPGWKIQRTDLSRRFSGMTFRRLNRVSRELQLAGYLQVHPIKMEDGRFAGWRWLVGAQRHPEWAETARTKFRVQEEVSACQENE